MTLGEIARVIRGRLLGGGEDIVIRNISTDGRLPQKEALFFALRGERFDGHDFLHQAHRNGCVAGVVEYIPPSPPPMPLIQVENTLEALGRLAKHHRQKHPILSIGVTGSNGKTTTKELIAHILSRRYEVLKSRENYNNEIGVPLTILQLDPSHQILVVEMAMRGKGQIAYLSEISQPSIGVITNIGLSHLEFFRSREEIAEAKAELLEALPKEGRAILNADDPFFDFLRGKARCPVISFGFSPGADVKGEGLKEEDSGLSLTVHSWRGAGTLYLPLIGKHNAMNLLASVATALLVDMSLEEIGEVLPSFVPLPMRMEMIRLPNGTLIINDSYNASPSSLESALLTLKEKKGRKIAVLGEMLELGAISEEAHLQAGRWVYEAGVDLLISVGKGGEYIARGAKENGFVEERIFHFPSREGISTFLKEILKGEEVVLIKGSRKVELDKVVEELKACFMS